MCCIPSGFQADPAPKAILIDDFTTKGGSFDHIWGEEGGGRGLKSPSHSTASDRPPRNRPDVMSLLNLAFVAMWRGVCSFPSLQYNLQ